MEVLKAVRQRTTTRKARDDTRSEAARCEIGRLTEAAYCTHAVCAEIRTPRAQSQPSIKSTSWSVTRRRKCQGSKV